MKYKGIASACLAIAVSTITLTSTSATERAPSAVPLANEQHSFNSATFSTLSLPNGVNLREIFRHYNGKRERHATLYFFPQYWNEWGWRTEGSMGFISSTPFEHSRPLYACQLNGIRDAFFTSVDSGCEGQFLSSFGMIGYISSVPLPNTQPLYRCYYNFSGRTSHFDTFDAKCENVPRSSLDGVLGYVFL